MRLGPISLADCQFIDLQAIHERRTRRLSSVQRTVKLQGLSVVRPTRGGTISNSHNWRLHPPGGLNLFKAPTSTARPLYASRPFTSALTCPLPPLTRLLKFIEAAQMQTVKERLHLIGLSISTPPTLACKGSLLFFGQERKSISC